ncbi:Uncharacterized conserved protein YecE, DUF72 family [Evansella caseinilytica]|uniref:Uncharacterized conserved protein YecE, DUF72 family n=1 Tax=Evansella caseinilytica TaxID=1503961 RepID=A0A1H3UCB1_9BACI|nr:DUF72 domain-containing protein [Evansella caseinilytica]SDZ60102.1 Uncharacterized conserved protein YecE, DUF72 family [Evansella caseinilytica]
MIWVGLTGWGDHDSLYQNARPAKDKLAAYAGHFPTVELDSSFYAVPPRRNVEKWIQETPENFTFVVKAYQGITGHQRGEIPFQSKKEMFDAFIQAVEPLKQAGKLAMVLCQFPPWFDCRKENVDYLRYCRSKFKDVDAALEFRHQSWFTDTYKEKTLEYMKKECWIHSICDEPQAGERSIPFVPEVTTQEKTLVRLHGRNVYGWNKPADGQEWRDVRYLYDYNSEEIAELSSKITAIAEGTQECFVLFNNNSGGHAAGNAKQFIEQIGIKYRGLAPRQLDLFSE